jgi:TonB-dependent starch-binding outer membrane protein SusC
VEDASFVKLREVTLSYEVPNSLTSRLWGVARNARLSLSGRNLLTFTDYTGLDPEVSNFGNQNIARNIDVAPFPPSRSFWLGVELVF